jgi:hypothetical protein
MLGVAGANAASSQNGNSAEKSVSSLVFVDSAIDDYQFLASGIRDARVIVLDAHKNGIEQITEALAVYRQLHTIQLISHGAAGALYLGSSRLDSDNIRAYQHSLKRWGESLAADGDLILYGCNVAAGEKGRAFIRQLEAITRADISASTNPTGDNSQGGDWILEYGNRQSVTAWAPPGIQAGYHGVLAATVVSNTSAIAMALALTSPGAVVIGSQAATTAANQSGIVTAGTYGTVNGQPLTLAQDGVMLTTGHINGTAGAPSAAGDADVNTALGVAATFDASSLTIGFTVPSPLVNTSITFDLIFASNEAIGGAIPDAAVIMVDGVNNAKFNNGQILSNQHAGLLFNAPGVITGFANVSPVQTFYGLLDPYAAGGVHTIKIAIADNQDNLTTSAVIISNMQVSTINQTGRLGVGDLFSPVITVAVPVLPPVEATGPTTAVTITPPVVTDNIDVGLVATAAPASPYPVGNTVITWTATDAAGNIGTATLVDTTPPVVTPPANATIAAASSATPVANAAVAAWLATAAAADVVGVAAFVNDAPATLPLGPTLVTFTATDAAGNSGTATATITMADQTAPVITPPANITVMAAPGATTVPASNAAIAAFLAGVTATDNVDGVLAAAAITNNGPASYPVGTTTVTFTATDAAGNPSTAQANVVVTAFPGAIVTADTLAANLALTLTQFSAGITVTNQSVVAAANQTGQVTNTALGTVNGAPLTLNRPGIMLTTGSILGAGVNLLATGDPYVEAELVADPVAATTGTFDASSLSISFTVPADVYSVSLDLVFASNEAIGGALPDAAVIMVDGVNARFANGQMISNQNPGLLFATPGDVFFGFTNVSQLQTYYGLLNPALTTHTITIAIADNADHLIDSALIVSNMQTSTINQTGRIGVADIFPPVIQISALAPVEATGPLTFVNLGAPIVTDNVDMNLRATPAPLLTSYPVGNTVITWTATDAAGNVGTATQTVVITDTTAPAFTVFPVNDTYAAAINAAGTPAADPVVAAWLASAQATDLASVPVITHNAPATLPLGANLVTFTATDAAGLTDVYSSTIWITDQTPPVITPPANIAVVAAAGAVTVPATQAAIVAFLAGATATDNVDGVLAPAGITNNGPASYPTGTTTVTFTAVDAAGNTSTAQANVVVTAVGGAQIVADSVAASLVSALVPIDSYVTPLAGSALLTAGAGQSGRVTNTSLGLVNGQPVNLNRAGVFLSTGNLTGNGGNMGQPGDIDVFNALTPATPGTFDAAALSFSFTVPADAYSVSFDLIFASDEAITPTPDAAVIMVDGVNQAKFANGQILSSGQAGFLFPTPGNVIPGFANVSLLQGFTGLLDPYAAGGVHTIKIAIADNNDALVDSSILVSNMQTSRVTQAGRIGVGDVFPPVVVAPADIMGREATGITTFVRLGTPTVTDNVDLNLRATATPLGPYPVGLTVVTWTTADAAGNVGVATQNVEIVDTSPPTMLPLANTTVAAVNAAGVPVANAAVAAWLASAKATDIASIPVITNNAPATLPLGPNLVTFTATDAAGLTDIYSATINVTDQTAPVMVAPANITIVAKATQVAAGVPSTDAAIQAFLNAVSATDNVDGILAPASIANNGPANYPVGTTTVTFTATDAAGNASQVQANVVVMPFVGAAVVADLNPVSLVNTLVPAGGQITPVPASGTIVAAASQGGRVINTSFGRVNAQPLTLSRNGVMLSTGDINGAGGNRGTAGDADIFNAIRTNPLTLTTGTLDAAALSFSFTVSPASVTAITFELIFATNELIGGALPDTAVIMIDGVNNAVFNNGHLLSNQNAPAAPAPAFLFPTNGAVISGFSNVSQVQTFTGLLDPYAAGGVHTIKIAIADNNDPLSDSAIIIANMRGSTINQPGRLGRGDVFPPVITVSPLVLPPVEATGPTTLVNLGGATVTDNVDVNLRATPNPPGPFPVGQTAVIWSATDAAGNTGTVTQTVTIIDTTAPVLTILPAAVPPVPAVSALGAPVTDPAIAAWLASARASDAVGVVAINHNAAAMLPLGPSVVTFTAVDAAGNVSAPGTATINITDQTGPVITPPANVVVAETSAGAGVPVTHAAIQAFLKAVTATDNVDGAVPSVRITNNSPALFPAGATPVTFTATDLAGNQSTAQANVVVTPFSGAVVTADTNATNLANVLTQFGPITPLTPLVIANAGQTGIVSSTNLGILNALPLVLPAAQSVMLTTGNILGNGNNIGLRGDADVFNALVANAFSTSLGTSDAASLTFNFTTTAPSITFDLIFASNEGIGGAMPDTAVIMIDGVNNAVFNNGRLLSNQNIPAAPAPAFLFPTPGNIISGFTNVSMLQTFTGLLDPYAAGGVHTIKIAIADNMDALVDSAIIISNMQTSSVTQPGSIGHGDAVPPLVTVSVPVLPSVEATGVTTAVNLRPPTVTDNVDQNLRATPTPPGPYPMGSTVITWTATDAAGNVGTATQTVTIVDTTKPNLVAPANTTFAAVSFAGIPVTNAAVSTLLNSVVATDAVGVVSLTNNAPSIFRVGTTVVTFNAKDAAGNLSTASTTITVTPFAGGGGGAPIGVDQIPPVLRLNGNAEVTVLQGAAYADAGATAADNFDGPLNGAIITTNPVNTALAGNYTVTYRVSDAAGNSTSIARTVHVVVAPPGVDVLPPVVTAPADILVAALNFQGLPKTHASLAAFFTATATDNVGLVGAVANDAPAQLPVGKTLVTFTARDAAGNTGKATATITVSGTKLNQVAAAAVADVDLDGIPDGWEMATFGDLITASATTDFDGDGLLDALERILGTNARLANSNASGGATDLKDVVSIINPSDSDGDGVIDALEDNGSALDASIATGVPSANRGTTFTINANGNILQSVAVDPVTGGPDNILTGFGMLAYNVRTLAGQTITIRIGSSQPFGSSAQFYKVDQAGNFALIPSSQIRLVDANTIDLTITDGGRFDLDGLANGVIVDPIAVGAPPNVVGGFTGSGGGCVVASGANADPLFPVLVLLACLMLWRRRRTAQAG